MSLHSSARVGFGRAADAYERGRPGYPDEAVTWLAQRAGIGAGTRVLDLTAGTGKLTRLLVPLGARLVAVEPVEAMRRALTAAVPAADVRAGLAEDIPLPDGSVEVVVTAQAFHWFANDTAVAEIARVLAPGGRLALVWNARDGRQPLQVALRALCDRYRGDTPDFSTGRWREPLGRSEDLVPEGEVQFPYVQDVDTDGLVDRMLSVSYLASQPADERERVAQELRALAAAQPAPLQLHYLTTCLLYRRAAG